MNALARYARWLHTGWPAGRVERLPATNEDGSTNVPGVFIVGDLRGIPLLKFSADTGARAVRAIAEDPAFLESSRETGERALDLVIVGGGVSGMAAALEAKKRGLAFRMYESTEAFSTIVNFPKGKPIFTYPKDMVPAGDLQMTAAVKEPLVDELRRQTIEKGIQPILERVERVRRAGRLLEVALAGGEKVLARRVIVALGRSGNFRKLGVPGEDRDKVTNRLHDPADFAGRNVLVVGGGDSALETAIALERAGAEVALSYRKAEFSRPKPENAAMLSEGRIRVMLSSAVLAIGEKDASVRHADGRDETIPNDAVFTMIGREAPLEFFRRSGIAIRGEKTPAFLASLAAVLLFCVFLYHWKAGGALTHWFQERGLFPFQFGTSANPASLAGTLAISMGGPGFWYSLAYCACVVGFGLRRMRQRSTPYLRAQTWTLMAVQCLPLFLLPYVLLPFAGHNGAFDAGFGKSFADALFPLVNYEHGREYWRAFGFILAWPLFLWNFFTERPMGWWLAIGAVQTFVLIPLLVLRWGKGAYCGWICSCGALAETLGDAHRTKMPHGPAWNRVNLTGQVILGLASFLLLLRVAGWALPRDHVVNAAYAGLLFGQSTSGAPLPFPLTFLNYKWFVDLFLAGIVGVGMYFHFSGRVWCRFACPLAALMHIYARFSRFAIVAEKKKCISCNVCTSVCHQGIDVMSFANKGAPMQDPQCVRCSACVQSCPTGVLQFGAVDAAGRTIAIDRLAASPVRMTEGA